MNVKPINNSPFNPRHYDPRHYLHPYADNSGEAVRKSTIEVSSESQNKILNLKKSIDLRKSTSGVFEDVRSSVNVKGGCLITGKKEFDIRRSIGKLLIRSLVV